MDKYELLQKLRQMEETQLVDLLGLTSTEIVDAFLDKIEEDLNYLYGQIGEEDEEERN